MIKEKEEKIKYLISALTVKLRPGQCYDILNELEWLNEWERNYEEVPACRFLYRKLTDELMKGVNE